MGQVERLRIAGLSVEVVLQFPPVAEVAAAVAAMDGRTVGGVVGDVHLDCPARLAVELVIEPSGIHRAWPLLSARFSARNA